MAGIELKNIDKGYQVDGKALSVLEGICLLIPERKITVLLGRSGCGKTTLLRIVGGLEKPDRGTIEYGTGGRPAFVFQEPRLMPWLTVEKNIAFGLKNGKPDRAKVLRGIGMVGLKGFEKAYPDQLSGGMQQRAALARALVCDPSFIMMDEPFAALDYFTRAQMQQEILRLQEEEKISILFVTHSIDEALILADRIAIMENHGIRTEIEIPFPHKGRDMMSVEMLAIRKKVMESLNFGV